MGANDVVIASVIIFILFITTFMSSAVNEEFGDGSTSYNLENKNVLGNQTQNIENVSSKTGFLEFFFKAFVWNVDFNVYFNIIFWVLKGALIFILFRALWPGGGA
jgi:hypothetical protein